MPKSEKLTADIQLPNFSGTDPRLLTWRRQHAAPPDPVAPKRGIVAKTRDNWRTFLSKGRR